MILDPDPRYFGRCREGFATPKVHACVFDIATGELKELDWMNNKVRRHPLRNQRPVPVNGLIR